MHGISGKEAEELAEKFLQKNKFKIICKNFSSPFGEIDFVARDKNTLCFIEVRKRNKTSFTTPEESISFSKRKKIIKTSLWFITKYNPKFEDIRYDVVCVVEEPYRIKLSLLKDAFDVKGKVL